MVEYLQKLLLGSAGRSVIRKLMVLLGGVLLGMNIDPSIVDQFTSSGTEILIALLSIVLAQGWSTLERKLLAKAKLDK